MILCILYFYCFLRSPNTPSSTTYNRKPRFAMARPSPSFLSTGSETGCWSSRALYLCQPRHGSGLCLAFRWYPRKRSRCWGLGGKSELANRMILVNLLRNFGAVDGKKASHPLVTWPRQVILPLSLKHGFFGSDGFLSEFKMSVDILFQRWTFESWGEYLCLAGAVIG